MATNKNLIGDAFYMVWAEVPLTQEHYAQGYNQKSPSQVAFIGRDAFSEKLVHEVQRLHPGMDVFVAKSVRKYPVTIQQLPTLVINDAGEVLPA